MTSPEQMSIEAAKPAAVVQYASEALAFSAKFTNEKANIGEAEKEHILGLCSVVQGLLDHINATPGMNAARPVPKVSKIDTLRDALIAARAVVQAEGANATLSIVDAALDACEKE